MKNFAVAITTRKTVQKDLNKHVYNFYKLFYSTVSMKYFLSATFLTIIFIYAIYFCVVVIINNSRVRRDLFYQYNYIPAPLINTVKIHKLK